MRGKDLRANAPVCPFAVMASRFATHPPTVIVIRASAHASRQGRSRSSRADQVAPPERPRRRRHRGDRNKAVERGVEFPDVRCRRHGNGRTQLRALQHGIRSGEPCLVRQCGRTAKRRSALLAAICRQRQPGRGIRDFVAVDRNRCCRTSLPGPFCSASRAFCHGRMRSVPEWRPLCIGAAFMSIVLGWSEFLSSVLRAQGRLLGALLPRDIIWRAAIIVTLFAASWLYGPLSAVMVMLLCAASAWIMRARPDRRFADRGA